MQLPPGLRKAALTAHVTFSVGWLGAVTAFLVLAVTGLVGSEPAVVRGAYVAAAVITWFAIVPLGLAALASGLLQALGTSWGLLRHYWVLIKLVLTALATLVLLVHAGPIGLLGDAAARPAFDAAEFSGLRVQLVVQAAAALVVLLAATALSVVKPRGETRRGVRARAALRGEAQW